jgi:hypothetical protein
VVPLLLQAASGLDMPLPTEAVEAFGLVFNLCMSVPSVSTENVQLIRDVAVGPKFKVPQPSTNKFASSSSLMRKPIP